MTGKLLDVGYHVEYWDIEVNHLRFALVKGFGRRPYIQDENRGVINVIVIKDEDREKITISDRSILNVCDPKGDGIYRHYPFWKGPESAPVRMTTLVPKVHKDIPISVEDLDPKLVFEATLDALIERQQKMAQEGKLIMFNINGEHIL